VKSPVNVNIVHFPDLYFFKEAIIGRINGMFERYTEAARGVVVSSKHKASHVGSPEIDTEHLLLGLLSKDQTLARRFLGSPWAADLVWRRIEQSGKIGEPIKGPCDLPLSSMCKRALSYAAEEADGLSSKHISTEHLLVGLLREQKCFAAEYLYEHGVRLASVREELKRTPHKYSASDKFVREAALPEDVVEQQNRVKKGSGEEVGSTCSPQKILAAVIAKRIEAVTPARRAQTANSLGTPVSRSAADHNAVPAPNEGTLPARVVAVPESMTPSPIANTRNPAATTSFPLLKNFTASRAVATTRPTPSMPHEAA